MIEMNLEGRPGPGTTGLILEEGTIFDRNSPGRTGFSLPPLDVPAKKPSQYRRSAPAELPEVSELDVVRHFTRLSSYNYSIDQGTFPLGSCTMKYNPRINEEIAALPGLSDIHPSTPAEFCQGALEVIYRLEKALCAVSGMDDCSTQPAAGAHGEFTGLLVIRKFHEMHQSDRKYVLIPDSAHGTNPASCTLAGYTAITLPSSEDGTLSVDSVESAIRKYGREIAAMMVTNPNTLGVFESKLPLIAQLIHEIGAQLYMDGANMNAIMGMAKPGDMGVDVMQFNLHKTFSTPHGGGGPGSGPVAVKTHLAPYLPSPRIRLQDNRFVYDVPKESIGKVKGNLGNFGVLVRALTYILHHGSDGLKRVSAAAVLNSAFLRQALSKHFSVAVSTGSLHECVLTDREQLKANGTKTLQVAKALIDEGFHPPTVYFPLIVPGALLIEPTETESLQDLTRFAEALIHISRQIVEKKETFEQSPTKTIVGKVDEVGAARRPILSLDDRTR